MLDSSVKKLGLNIIVDWRWLLIRNKINVFIYKNED